MTAPSLADPLWACSRKGLAHVREDGPRVGPGSRTLDRRCPKGVPALQLTIPPSPVHLAGLRRAARASLCEVSSEVAEEVVLAVDEAVTNAILYGSGAGQPVEVAVEVTADWVEATILDHGPALPPASLLAGGDPEALGTHGRGLRLLRQLVDEVRLERVRRGTRVTLRRWIGPPRALVG